MINLQKSLRVVHFSTGHLGGAGLAARRLNQALISAGVNSSFHALPHDSFSPSLHEFTVPRSFVAKLMGKLVTYLNLRIEKKVFFSLFFHNTLNSGFFDTYKEKNTILHFHNFFNLTTQNTIFSLSKQGYNVVVTLHDQRIFTGGCHYAFDCNGFESSCPSCPQAPRPLRPLVARSMKHTRRLALTDTKLYLVAPSKWMKAQAERSRLVLSDHTRFIPNNLGPSFTSGAKKPRKSGDSARFTLGVASMDLNSYIKGGDIVDDLMAEVGLNHFPLDFVSMRDFHGENGTASFWESIDCLLVLSRADNSPNVIHEAKSFGIPIVGNALGGITELLDPDFDYLVKDFEISSMEIRNYLEGLYFSSDFKEKQSRMEEKFKNYVGCSLDEHLKLYRLILESHD